ncbi:MAG: hypothetical protein Q4C87_00885 [Actinomycetaceae bacterium]|nr:hypothetical protein [Actinomycetaceae bacterium]
MSSSRRRPTKKNSASATGASASRRAGASSAGSATAPSGATAQGRGGGRGGNGRGKKKRPVNLWPRRIITGGGALLILSLLIWGIWAGISALLAPRDTTASQSAGPVEERSKDGIVIDDGPVQIPECSGDHLDIKVEVGDVAAGKPLTTPVVLTNSSDIACSTTFGGYALVVKSGEDTIYDGRKCEGIDPAATPLLLSPKTQWTGNLTWNGTRHNGCAPVDSDGNGAADPALPGTYRLQIFSGENAVGDEVSFNVK